MNYHKLIIPVLVTIVMLFIVIGSTTAMLWNQEIIIDYIPINILAVVTLYTLWSTLIRRRIRQGTW